MCIIRWNFEARIKRFAMRLISNGRYTIDDAFDFQCTQNGVLCVWQVHIFYDWRHFWNLMNVIWLTMRLNSDTRCMNGDAFDLRCIIYDWRFILLLTHVIPYTICLNIVSLRLTTHLTSDAQTWLTIRLIFDAWIAIEDASDSRCI